MTGKTLRKVMERSGDENASLSKDFVTRYQNEDIQQLMSMATLLDPMFKAAPFMSPGQKLNYIYADCK